MNLAWVARKRPRQMSRDRRRAIRRPVDPGRQAVAAKDVPAIKAARQRARSRRKVEKPRLRTAMQHETRRLQGIRRPQ